MFIRALKAEYIKTKASGLKWLCLGAAIFIPLLQFIFLLSFSDTDFTGKPENPWMSFILGSVSGFAPFFYPLLCVLIVVRLAQFEHKADAWKLLETQPVSRSALYFSKWVMCLITALICLLLLLFFSSLFVFILSLANPSEDFKTTSINWGQTFGLIFRVWIAGFGMMALQYLLSITIPNFVAPFVIGLIATIAGSVMSGFDVLPWWMYSAPGNTSSYFDKSSDWMLPHEWLSLLFMLLFLFLGYRLFRYKKIRYAVYQPSSRLIAVLASILVFAFAFWYINKPKQLQRGNSTVLAGKISSKDKIDKLYLLDGATRDTVQVISMEKNRFSAKLAKEITPSYYYLKIGNQMQQVFMGTGDSLYIDASISELRTKKTITGTRLAENSYSDPNAFQNNMWFLEDMAYQFKPKDYARQILQQWKLGEKRIESFKTVNNIKPANDFLLLQKKMLRLKLLQLLDQHYPQVFRVYYPNDTLNYPKEVEELRKTAPLNDPDLLYSDQYIEFLSNYYRMRSHAISDSSFYSYVVQEFPAGKVKDVFLYRSLSEFISKSSDSIRRQNFIESFGSAITSARLISELKAKNSTINSMKRGKPAPEIHAETLAGNALKLSDLKNRFIVLDVWATWCGPCKKEAPYFKDLAERYTSEDIAFVSISIDEKKQDWKIEAAGKAEKVLQLWASNAGEELAKNYNVEFIPRFILIDNKGRIVNAQMPRPSEPEFENILRRETAALYQYR